MTARSPADMPGAAMARLAALEADLASTRLALWRAGAAIKHPVLADVADMLEGDESAVLASADRLATVIARRP